MMTMKSTLAIALLLLIGCSEKPTQPRTTTVVDSGVTVQVVRAADRAVVFCTNGTDGFALEIVGDSVRQAMGAKLKDAYWKCVNNGIRQCGEWHPQHDDEWSDCVSTYIASCGVFYLVLGWFCE